MNVIMVWLGRIAWGPPRSGFQMFMINAETDACVLDLFPRHCEYITKVKYTFFQLVSDIDI